MRRLVFFSATTITLAVASSSLAGERSTVSSLPVLPPLQKVVDPAEKPVVPGLYIERLTGGYLSLRAATTFGYCIVSRDQALQLWESVEGSHWSKLWRFTETEDGAKLEKTQFEVRSDEVTARVVGRTSVALRAVARRDGVTVWGFREPNGEVTLLARKADMAREADGLPRRDEHMLGFASSQCGWGAVRLAGKTAKAGTIARLSGMFPRPEEEREKRAASPLFVVDASLSKLSREPEPMLSVRIRIIGD